MQFTKFDVKVLVVSAIALLIISATASATPIDGGYGDIPEFDTNAEMNLNVPTQPGPEVSTQGDLVDGPNVSAYKSYTALVKSQNLDVNLSAAGYKSNENDTDVNVVLLHTDKTTDPKNESADSVTITEGESAELTTKEVRVIVEAVDATDSEITVEYDVENYPNPSEYGEDNNGGIRGAISTVGEWIGYIAQLIAFAFSAAFSFISFVFTGTLDVFGYVIDLLGWLTGGYSSIISSSPTWASPFVGLPALLLGLEFMKIIALLVDIVWLG